MATLDIYELLDKRGNFDISFGNLRAFYVPKRSPKINLFTFHNELSLLDKEDLASVLIEDIYEMEAFPLWKGFSSFNYASKVSDKIVSSLGRVFSVNVRNIRELDDILERGWDPVYERISFLYDDITENISNSEVNVIYSSEAFDVISYVGGNVKNPEGLERYLKKVYSVSLSSRQK